MIRLKENEKEFILRLEQLTRETGVAIDGCGCCGSPFLVEAENVDDPSTGYSVRSGGNELAWNTIPLSPWYELIHEGTEITQENIEGKHEAKPKLGYKTYPPTVKVEKADV